MENMLLTASILIGIAILLPGLSKNLSVNMDSEAMFCRSGMNFISENERSLLGFKLIQAGLDYKAELFAGIKVVLAGAVLILTAVCVLVGGINYILMLFLAPVLYIIPGIWLNNRIAGRQLAIKKEVSDFAVYLYTGLSGGGDLLLALREAAKGLDGPLAKEIERALSESATGRNIVDALDASAKRCGVDSFSLLVRDLIQAYRHGSPLAEAMQNIAARMRMERKYEMQEAGSRLSIQLVIPVLMFDLVPMFAIIFYPVGCSLLQVF